MFPVLGPRLACIIRLKIAAKREGRTPKLCAVHPSIVDEIACELVALNVANPKLHKLNAQAYAERIRAVPPRLQFDGLQLMVVAMPTGLNSPDGTMMLVVEAPVEAMTEAAP